MLRWPVGSGGKEKAQALLQKALAIAPKSIDANFFYGEYLVENAQAAQAVPYLQQAIDAPPRPGREIGDAGRRAEARALLEQASRKPEWRDDRGRAYESPVPERPPVSGRIGGRRGGRAFR